MFLLFYEVVLIIVESLFYFFIFNFLLGVGYYYCVVDFYI